MNVSLFIDLVQEYGYFAMFLFNWVMLLGIPLPGETAAILSGVVTETGSFYPPLAFLCAYTGLFTSNLFTYFIGRVLAARVLERLGRARGKNNMLRFRQAFDKYGGLAISFSFFLPGFRMVMPYVTGANRYPLPRYILYAGTASFFWSLIYFQVGRAFPGIYEEILTELQRYLIVASITIVIGGTGAYVIRRRCLLR